jgi:PKD repeat protein
VKRKSICGIIALALIFVNLGLFPIGVFADSTPPTASLTVTKHNAHGIIISTQTLTLAQLEAMPIVGDGTTHYYCEENISGATTQDEAWDVNETNTAAFTDMGTPQGTDVKDLCNLVGGASTGDTIVITGSDGYSSSFPYENIYYPQPRQGQIIIAWNNPFFGGDVPNFANGMRLEFMAQTTNADGLHVYGLWDMHETLPPAFWGYTDGPATSHLSVKYVSNIDIYESYLVSCDASGNPEGNFVPGGTVYVKGTGLAANTAYKLWVQPAPVLLSTIGAMGLRTGISSILSAATDPSGSQELITTDSNGDFSPIAVWNIASSAASGTRWDIVADNQSSGTIGVFDPSDSIDNAGYPGFTVANSLPVASFTADVMTGGSPLTVHFTDQSAGSYPISYAWDFDNNGTVESTDPDPIYTFNNPGSYSVKLKVITSDGTNQIVEPNYITVTAPQQPVAAFTASAVSGPSPFTVRFTDQSTGPPTSWAWDFNNDGVIDSTLQNPTYTYNTPGTYTVTLAVSNVAGSDSETKTGYIVVTPNSGSNTQYPWADWPLTVSGYTTVSISQADFAALAADTDNTSQIYTNANGDSFKGVALWRLIAEVDGGDPTTLNTALIGHYSIEFTGQNPDQSTYSIIISPPYTGFDFYSSSEDIIIANQEELAGTTTWTPLPFSYINSKGNTQLSYPLLLCGSGVALISDHVSALTEIQLLGLPIEPPSSSGIVTLQGAIQPTLQFTPPSVTGWGSGLTTLGIGQNDAWGTMNVVSNESWQVTAAAQSPSSGSMLLYNGSSPVSPTVMLSNALVINSPIPATGVTPISITLTSSPQILATGTPATQATNNSGDPRGVDFSQKVTYQDPASGSGTYQIIVIFTASPTGL